MTYRYQIEVNKWYHLVYVYDGSKMKIYVNGNMTVGEISNSILVNSGSWC